MADNARRLALLTTDEATADYMNGEATDCDEVAAHMEEAAGAV